MLPIQIDDQTSFISGEIQQAELQSKLLKENAELKKKIWNVKQMMGEALDTYRDPLDALELKLEITQEEEKELQNPFKAYQQILSRDNIKDVKKLSEHVRQQDLSIKKIRKDIDKRRAKLLSDEEQERYERAAE